MELLRIKEIMKEKGISGKDLADAMGVTPASISNIVQGNSFPKPDLLLNIARFLDVDIREMFYSTKSLTDKPLINGYLELDGEINKITSVDDFKDLLTKIEKINE